MTQTVLILGLVCLVGACDRDRDVILEELKELELSTYEERDLDRKTEQELLEAIQYLEDQVDRTVNAGVHLGTYYKMVAIRYRDRRLYGLAAEYFEKALGVYPENHYLAYWAGVCEARRAAAVQEFDERLALMDVAKRHYERAIELEPRYTDALYALAVLHVFEYEEPAAAEPLLERVLAVESRHFRAMFLLARVYVVFGRIDDAVDLYDRIAEESSLDSMVMQAKENRAELTGSSVGSRRRE